MTSEGVGRSMFPLLAHPMLLHRSVAKFVAQNLQRDCQTNVKQAHSWHNPSAFCVPSILNPSLISAFSSI
jgi:hypothetical protein